MSLQNGVGDLAALTFVLVSAAAVAFFLCRMRLVLPAMSAINDHFPQNDLPATSAFCDVCGETQELYAIYDGMSLCQCPACGASFSELRILFRRRRRVATLVLNQPEHAWLHQELST